MELLKNVDDSLKRIEKTRALTNDEKIMKIFCKRGKRNSYLIIIDNAEGMTKEKLTEIIRYGGAVSGREENPDVAGLFGIGLKDAIYGIGAGLYSKITERINCGEIITVKDNNWYKVDFFVINEEGIEKAKFVIPYEYNPFEKDLELISNGHGTIVKIFSHNIQFPQHPTLKRLLIDHIRLRDLLSSENRKVQLININQNTTENLKWTQTWELEETIYDDIFQLDEYPGVDIKLKIYRANKILNYKDPVHGDRGLLIRSKGDIHELTLFSYTNNEHSKAFYGDLYTELIDKLIEQREEVLEQSRTGLNRSHPFYISLKKKVDEILKELVQQEENRTKSESHIKSDTNRTLKSLNLLLKQIGADELTEDEALIGPEQLMRKTRLPDFGFISRSRKIYVNIESTIDFYARFPEELNIGDVVEFNIDNNLIELNCAGFKVEEDYINNNILKFPIKLKGLQTNIEGNLVAKCGEKQDSVKITVIEKLRLNSFGFSIDKYKIPISGKKNITFSAEIDDQVEVGDPISFNSNNWSIEVQPLNSEIEDNQDGFFLSTLTIMVSDDADIGDIGEIKAECSGKEAMVKIEIVAESPKQDFPGTKLDDQTENPMYPVLFNRKDNAFVVYTKDRTVKPFWDSTLKDQINDNVKFKIRFADLIVEATVDYIVGRKLENVRTQLEDFWNTQIAQKMDIYRNVAHKIYHHLGL